MFSDNSFEAMFTSGSQQYCSIRFDFLRYLLRGRQSDNLHLARTEFLYIDEMEAETVCRARVRLSMVRLDEMSGFVGGLA